MEPKFGWFANLSRGYNTQARKQWQQSLLLWQVPLTAAVGQPVLEACESKPSLLQQRLLR